MILWLDHTLLYLQKESVCVCVCVCVCVFKKIKFLGVYLRSKIMNSE